MLPISKPQARASRSGSGFSQPSSLVVAGRDWAHFTQASHVVHAPHSQRWRHIEVILGVDEPIELCLRRWMIVFVLGQIYDQLRDLNGPARSSASAYLNNQFDEPSPLVFRIHIAIAVQIIAGHETLLRNRDKRSLIEWPPARITEISTSMPRAFLVNEFDLVQGLKLCHFNVVAHNLLA